MAASRGSGHTPSETRPPIESTAFHRCPLPVVLVTPTKDGAHRLDVFATPAMGSSLAGVALVDMELLRRMKVLLYGMAKEKVTLTLDGDVLRELRGLAGRRSLSAVVDRAIAAHVARMKHLAAVDEWLGELDREHGPIPPETVEWAAHLVDDWAKRARRRKVG
jgi:predicted transcriptional regulator